MILRILLFHLLIIFLFILSCSSNAHIEIEKYINDFNNNIERRLAGRDAIIKGNLMLLNQELLVKDKDSDYIERVKKEIKLLHEEREFLFTIEPSQLKIDYEIIEENFSSENVTEIIVKIKGRTMFRKPDEVSRIIDIPEEASYLKFYFKKVNDNYKLFGPVVHIISDNGKDNSENPLLSKTEKKQANK